MSQMYGQGPSGQGSGNIWIDLALAGLATAGDIFGGGQGPKITPQGGTGFVVTPPANQMNTAGPHGTWWDDLFGGGSTVNLFGMEVSRNVLLIGIGAFLFRKQLKRMLR